MLETLYYALRSYCTRNEKKSKEFANKYIDSEVDNALIGMLEAFMEAGPQVVLQLCVFEEIGWTTDTTHLGMTVNVFLTLKVLVMALMHWDTFKQDNYSTVGRRGTGMGDVGSAR